jgi:hypothetical protein
MDPWEAFSDNGPAPAPPPTSGPGTAAAAAPAPGGDLWGAFVDTGPKAKPAETVSTAKSALEGYLDTAGFGFHDEIKGLSEASGLPGWMGGFRAPIGAVWLGIEKLTGGDTAGTAYENGRDEIRTLDKAAEEQHPGAFLTGQVGGAVVAPSLSVGKGAVTVGQRALRAAGTGAVQGGIYGVGSGETASDRVTRGLVGAGAGAAIGAAASPVVDLAAAGLQKAGQTVQSAFRTARAEFDPTVVEREASKRIVANQAADLESRGPAWMPDEIAAAQQGNIPLTIADAGGERTLALARSAANQSPEGRAALEELARDRFAGQSTRAAAVIKGMTGVRNAADDQAAIEAAAQKANRPAYAKAYVAGDRPLWSPELERLTSAPALREAITGAAQRGKNRSVSEGMGGFNPTAEVTADGRLLFNKGPTGVPTYPNLQFWDYAQRELRDAANAATRGGKNEEAGALKGLHRQLLTELDKQVPEFQQARTGAAGFFGAENALEAGQKFVGAKGENAEFARALGKFNPEQRELFSRGFASELANRILELRDGQDVIKQAFLTSPASKQRIEMALGPDRARQLEVYLRAETLADRLRGAMGNSTTARQLTELGLAGAGTLAVGHGAMEGEWDTKHALTAALLFGAAYGKHRAQILDNSVARRIGEMLASNDPAVLHQGIQIVAKSTKLTDALRTAGDKISAALAGKVAPRSGLSAIQGPARSAADGEQPKPEGVVNK